MTPTPYLSRTFRRGLLFCCVLMVATAPGFAQATYTYQGNHYDDFFGAAFDAGMSVSGSFTLPIPLPANLTPLQTINTQDLDFTLSNGIREFTPANSFVCAFEVATGPNGQIVQWDIVLREPGVMAGDPQATLVSNRIVSATDGGYISIAVLDVCGQTGSSDSGVVSNNPGAWTSDAAMVPSMPTWGLLLLLALLAVAGGITLRGRQRA